jgi:hypothetical protein
MVRATGVEPITFGFGDRRSIQLSYARRTTRKFIMRGFANAASSITAGEMKKPGMAEACRVAKGDQIIRRKP